MRRWVLFVALAILQIVPIWSVRYFPTPDGPSHVYNSWLLRDLITGRANEAIRSNYAVDWRPHPNWMSSALMAAAMAVVPPLVAEKLLLSLIVLTFLGAAWSLGREKRRSWLSRSHGISS